MFTYIVPLTGMRMKTFLLLTTVGRIPGIVVSTYAADGLMDGRIVQSVVLFAVLAVIALVGVLNSERIMNVFGRHAHHGRSDGAGRSGGQCSCGVRLAACEDGEFRPEGQAGLRRLVGKRRRRDGRRGFAGSVPAEAGMHVLKG